MVFDVCGPKIGRHPSADSGDPFPRPRGPFTLRALRHCQPMPAKIICGVRHSIAAKFRILHARIFQVSSNCRFGLRIALWLTDRSQMNIH
jgi:hypothetical protein